VPIFLALAAAGAAIGYRAAPAGIAEKLSGWFAAEDEIPVHAVQVRRGSLAVELEATGELRPAKEVDVVSLIPGFVEKIRYKVGDAVAAGQVVASLRVTEFVQKSEQTEAALKTAQADLSANETRLNDLEKELERTRDLRARDLIAGQDLRAAETAATTARAQMELAQAQVAQQRASLEQWRYLTNFSKLMAPFNGVVTRRMSEPGIYLQRSEPVMTVASLDVMGLTVAISEENPAGVQRGMSARITVDAIPGRVFEGRVVEVHSGPEDSDSKTAVEIRLANPEHLLKPGMRASVYLPTGEKPNVLLVPRQAVTETAGKSYVDVVTNGRVQHKAITVGRKQETTVEVAGGVGEGDWVVIQSRQPLTAKSRVRIAPENPNPGR
jgi:RND family efflux transporter MFP subunit